MSAGEPTGPRVLIVTGAMISAKERSFARVLRKQLKSVRESEGPWLDIQSKLAIAELLIAQRLHLRSRAFRRAPYRRSVEAFFADRRNFDTPELTEVLLATLLEREGLAFEVSTWAELWSDRALRERLLGSCDAVFASTTLLRDTSELATVAAMLEEGGGAPKVIAGGALVTMLEPEHLAGVGGVDLFAIGHGERLVPPLARWIGGGCEGLPEAPPGGRVERQGGALLMYSGLPESRDLDDLPRPDWALAERVHGRAFPMVYYESARGCPYRCGFCNYPFLFGDGTFRMRSAAAIADDWHALAAGGARVITCLDSLFTTPKRRLRELCELLIARSPGPEWVCYGRAGDLADPELCELMRRAGCQQVQIGLESGSDVILANMNKRGTAADNARALANCRQAGITTVCTVILGYPGESPETIRESFAMLADSPPDVYYAAAFNARFEQAPVLREPEQAERFGLVSVRGGRAAIPYWRHDTMDASEVASWLAWFNRRMIEERVALEGSLFYGGILGYRAGEQRDELLAFQRDLYQGHPLVRATFRRLDRWAQRKVERDMQRMLP